MIHVAGNHENLGVFGIYRDIMSTPEGYHEYIGGYSIMIHLGHIMSTLGEQYLEYIGIYLVHQRGPKSSLAKPLKFLTATDFSA